MQTNAHQVTRNFFEALASGHLPYGDDYSNHHVFTFRLRDGRVAWVGEYMNPIIVNEQLLPHLQDAMTGSAVKEE